MFKKRTISKSEINFCPNNYQRNYKSLEHIFIPNMYILWSESQVMIDKLNIVQQDVNYPTYSMKQRRILVYPPRKSDFKELNSMFVKERAKMPIKPSLINQYSKIIRLVKECIDIAIGSFLTSIGYVAEYSEYSLFFHYNNQ